MVGEVADLAIDHVRDAQAVSCQGMRNPRSAVHHQTVIELGDARDLKRGAEGRGSVCVKERVQIHIARNVQAITEGGDACDVQCAGESSCSSSVQRSGHIGVSGCCADSEFVGCDIEITLYASRFAYFEPSCQRRISANFNVFEKF